MKSLYTMEEILRGSWPSDLSGRVGSDQQAK